jgi:hypothetical protein
MINSFINVLLRIWNSIEPPGSKCFNNKPAMKPVVINLSEHFLQAQHEWAEATICEHIQLVE